MRQLFVFYLCLVLMLILTVTALAEETNAVVIGDSIAQGYARQLNLSTSRTKVGASPATVYRFLKEFRKDRRNTSVKTIVLSTGLSNNPEDFVNVRRQFDVLTEFRDRRIMILGVSNQYRLYGRRGIDINAKLNALCVEYRFECLGGFNSNTKDHVHATRYVFSGQ